MAESVDLSREAGKENEQTLANLSPAQKATSKDEVEIEKFLQEQKSKNTQYKTKSDLKPWKSLEQLKTYLPMSSTFFCPNFSSPFVNKIALSTNRVQRRVCCSQTLSMTQTRRRFVITPLERPVLDDFSKQTFSLTSLHN